MSNNFEAVVRPFQLQDVAQPIRYVVPGQQEVKRVLLSFGRAGGGKVMSGSSSYQKNFYCDQQIVEKSS